MCLTTLGSSNKGKCVIKIPRFESDTPEEWIIVVHPVQKALVGWDITTGPPKYKYMEQVLKSNTKVEFNQ